MPRRSFDFSGSRARTNAELATEIATLTTLSANEIENMLPRRADKLKLAELITIVDSSSAQNKKVKALDDNFAELGGVTIKLLKRFLV